MLLRVVGRALVLWDGVQPTREWLQAQLPPVLRVRARSIAPLQWQLLLRWVQTYGCGFCLLCPVRPGVACVTGLKTH